MLQWSPEIAKEVQVKKKREREDNYVQNFIPESRPVLLVKKKQVFTEINQDKIFKDVNGADDFYRIPGPSKVIEDMAQEINCNEATIKRDTLIYGSSIYENLKDANNGGLVYKIEGIEFLPKGFIELDPILYKDEFSFDTAIQQQLFAEHQKKTVAMRRKQYDQRNQQKMRDVTLYIINEKKGKIIDYLERWYYENKRTMDYNELMSTAKLFEIDYDTMKELQDAYLKHKKAHNTYELRRYLENKNLLNKDNINIPKSLNNYFVHSSTQRSKSGKKRKDDKDKQNSSYLNKFKEQLEKSKSVNKNNSQLLIDGDKTMIKQVGKPDKSFQHEAPSFTYDPVSQSFNHNVKSPPVGYFTNKKYMHNSFNEESKAESILGYDKDNTLFYDEEVNKILDKMKGYRAVYKNSNGKNFKKDAEEDDEVNDKILDDTLNLVGDVIIESFKRRVIQTFTDENFDAEEVKKEKGGNTTNRNASEGRKIQYRKFSSREKKPNRDHLAKQIVQDHKNMDRRNTEKNKDLIPNSEPIRIKREVQSLRQKSPKISTQLNTNNQVTTDRKPDVPKNRSVSRSENTKEIDHGKSTENNKQLKTKAKVEISENIPKRTPRISKKANQDNKEEAPKNDRLKTKAISLQNKVKNEDDIRNKVNSEIKKNGKTEELIDTSPLINKNISIQPLPKRISTVARNSKGASKILQKLKPILYNDNYYFQIVEDVIDQNKSRRVTIKTLNHEGEILSQVELDNPQIGQLYENCLQMRVDENSGNELLSIIVVNEKGEAVTSNDIKVRVNSVWQDIDTDKLTQTNQEHDTLAADNNNENLDRMAFRESFDKNNNLIASIQKTKEDNVELKISRLAPVLIGTTYYYQIVEERFLENNKRKTTIITYNDEGSLISEKPFNSRLVSDSYYSKVSISNKKDNVKLETYNNNNKLIGKESIKIMHLKLLLLEGYENIVQEVFETDNQRKISLIKNDGNNNHKPILVDILPKESFNVYDIIERDENERRRLSTKITPPQKPEKNGTVSDNAQKPKIQKKNKIKLPKKTSMEDKSETPAFKNKNQESVLKKTNPDINMTLLGEQYYVGMVEKLFDDSESATSKNSKLKEHPLLVANTYYNDLLYGMLNKFYAQNKKKVTEAPKVEDNIRDKANTAPERLEAFIDKIKEDKQEKETNNQINNRIENFTQNLKESFNNKSLITDHKLESNPKTIDNVNKSSLSSKNKKAKITPKHQDNHEKVDLTQTNGSKEIKDQNTQEKIKLQSKESFNKSEIKTEIENSKLIKAVSINKKIEMVMKKPNTKPSRHNTSSNNGSLIRTKEDLDVTEDKVSPIKITNVKQHPDELIQKIKADIRRSPERKVKEPMTKPKNFTEVKAKPYLGPQNKTDEGSYELTFDHPSIVNSQNVLKEHDRSDNSANNGDRKMKRHDICVAEYENTYPKKRSESPNKSFSPNISRSQSKSKSHSKSQSKSNTKSKSRENHNKHPIPKFSNEEYNPFKTSNMGSEVKLNNSSEFRNSFLDKERTKRDVKGSNANTKKNLTSSGHKESYDKITDKTYNDKRSEIMNEFLKKPRTKSESRRQIDKLKLRMSQELKDNKEKFGDSMANQIMSNLESKFDEELMNEFYEYCQSALPSDFRYKDSVMFVTLFYYFLKKGNMVK